MPVMERIQAEVERHPIVLFMKGTPQFPMCGFSSRAIDALKSAGAGDVHTVNVLEEKRRRPGHTRAASPFTEASMIGPSLDDFISWLTYVPMLSASGPRHMTGRPHHGAWRTSTPAPKVLPH